MRLINFFLLLAMVGCSLGFEFQFPGVPIPPQNIEQARRAHQYLAGQLQEYRHNRMSKYSLYLAVENYKEVLDMIKIIVLEKIYNYISGSRNIVIGKGNIVLSSNNKLAGNNNWILTDKQVTSTSIETNILYFKKWRIKLDYIPQIEYHPELAIQPMNPEDEESLRHIKGIRDANNFRMKKCRRVNYHRI